jgi:hypothetical protein
MNSRRAAVIELYLGGKTPTEILKALSGRGVKRLFIYRTIKRYQETHTIEDRGRSGRPRTATAPRVVKTVALRIRRNPRRSMRKMAREIHISEGSMRTIVKKYLHMKSLKRKHAQFLTARAKQLRLERSKAMLQRFAPHDVEKILFTDEKIFTIEAVSNHQNDRILAPRVSDISDDLRIISHTQHPQSVMVWAGVSAQGRTNLVFVPQGVKINSSIYRDLILDPVVKQVGQTIFNSQVWTFQQDAAPAHTSNVSQAWLNSEIPDFISKDQWPPSSPDLNPMDYAVWSILETRAGVNAHHSIDSLKNSLLREWNNIPQDQLRASVMDFHRRLKACVTKRGGHFE